jgi:hypothetical protein
MRGSGIGKRGDHGVERRDVGARDLARQNRAEQAEAAGAGLLPQCRDLGADRVGERKGLGVLGVEALVERLAGQGPEKGDRIMAFRAGDLPAGDRCGLGGDAGRGERTQRGGEEEAAVHASV